MGLRCGVRSGDVMDSESWSERCDEARGQRHAVNNNVGSRFLTQKRAEQRGTGEVANK